MIRLAERYIGHNNKLLMLNQSNSRAERGSSYSSITDE